MIKVLLVDDEPALLDIGKIFLEKNGEMQVTTAQSAPVALTLFSQERFDTIVSDYEMPVMNGIEFLRAVREQDSHIPFIIFTGRGREEVAIEAINCGADFYLQKGGAPRAQFAELVHKIKQGTRRRGSEKKITHLNSVLLAIRDVHQLIGMEKDSDQLIHKVCDLLTATRGYRHVWISLSDDSGSFVNFAESGIGTDFVHFREKILNGQYPSCMKKALRTGGLVMFDNPEITCSSCPLFAEHKSMSNMIVRIMNRGRMFGVISASLPKEFADDEDERKLFADLGDDLAFAFHAIESATKREKAEQALQKSEALYRTLFETTGTATVILNEDFTVSHANREMARLSGYSLSEIERKIKWTSVVSEKDLPRLMEYDRLRRISPEKVPNSYEFSIKDAQGQDIDVFGTVALIPGTRQSVVSIMDLRKLKEAEGALQESLLIKENAIESSPTAISILDPEGNLTYVNRAFLKMWGYGAKEDLIGQKGIVISIASERRPDLLEKFWKTGSFSGEIEVNKKDGTPFDIHLSAKVVKKPDGEPIFIIASMIDITEIKNYQEALQKANEKLNLLSDVTRHDILNQLTSLLGYLELMKYAGREEVPAYIEKIEGLAKTIETQISFTSDYQHMGVLAPRWQRIDHIIEEVVVQSGYFSVNIVSDIGPLEVYADPLLTKVFVNLIDNALRHGDHVTRIGISFHETAAGGVISLEDNGKGVSADLKDRIFARGFGRNTGYGLFLVRAILDITGIAICETGAEGEGARFEIAMGPDLFRYA
jgi:PAS domain S-box-containing protein